MNNTLSIKDEIASLKDLIQNNPVVVEPPYSNIDPAARHPCGAAQLGLAAHLWWRDTMCCVEY